MERIRLPFRLPLAYRLRQSGRKIVRAGRKATREFHLFQGFNQSAALAYYALLSFIPLIFLAVAVAGLVLGDADEVRRLIETQVSKTAPWFQEEVHLRLGQFIGSAKGLGIVSLVGILWASSIFFGGLHNNLTVPWRHGGIRLARWRSVLPWLAGPILSLLLMVAMGLVHVLAYIPHAWLPQGYPAWWTWLSLSGAIFCLYSVLLPRCCPPVASAILALLLAGLSQGLTRVFSLLLTALPNYHLIYGPLAATVVFLLWLDYNMALILWGGHFIRIWAEDRPEGEE